jgi:Flp pilus assembly pilin Flp
MHNGLAQILGIFAGLITVAIVATLVSKNATTGTLITNTFSGFSGALNTALSPVTGNTGFSMSGVGSLNNLNFGG